MASLINKAPRYNVQIVYIITDFIKTAETLMSLYTYIIFSWAEGMFFQVSPIFLLNKAIIKSKYHNNPLNILDTESWHNAVLKEECAKIKAWICTLILHCVKFKNKTTTVPDSAVKKKRKAAGRIQIANVVLSARGAIWNILSIC